MKKVVLLTFLVLALGSGFVFLYSCGGGGGGGGGGETGTTYYADSDGDGFGDPDVTETFDSPQSGWVLDSTDCEDDPAFGFSINPAAVESCDDWIDNNCDDLVDCYDEVICDSDDACVACTDADADGYLAVDLSCSGGNDCADADSTINPGADADGDTINACEDCDDMDSTTGTGTAEVCNDFDDDCDWLVDEDFTDLGDPCTTGVGICEASGNFVCKGDQTGTECDAIPGSPVSEACNGLDDDCDGSTDEDFENLGGSCTVGVGVCESSGTYVCKADETGIECDAVAGVAGSETCNGLDDDCDGEIDEDLGAVDEDGDGYAVCGGDCNDTPGIGVSIYPGATEMCNEVDDDCDNETDEDFPGVNTVCTTGVGACLGQGVWECNLAGDGIECDAVAGTASTEICNNIDDDCDGSTDENNPGGGVSCTTGLQGICSAGTTNCDSGALVCLQTVFPVSESCNGLDDDCDGTPDNGPPISLCPLTDHAVSTSCSLSQCEIIACESGWYDCNETYSDGCESSVSCPE